jgi:hypothetical protein
MRGDIDLGLLEPPDLEPRLADPLRRLQSWWARRRRAVVPGLLAALVLGLVTGADSTVAPARVATVALPADGGGQYQVVGELVFIAENAIGWAAYDLSTGARRWSLASTFGGSLDLVEQGMNLFHWRAGIALDPATGEVVWARPGLRALPGARTGVAKDDYRWDPVLDDLLGHHAPARNSGRFNPYQAHLMSGIDLATGAVRWEETMDTGVRAWLVGDPPVALSVSGDDLVELRDPDTGVVRAGRRVPGVTDTSQPIWPFLLGDSLVMQTWNDEERVLRGYDVDTLAQRWELESGPGRHGWAEPCGPMLCLHHRERDEFAVDPATGGQRMVFDVQVLDPATGRVSWVTDGRRTVLLPAGERLVAYDVDAVPRAVLDARTGRPLYDLAGWPALTIGETSLTLLRPETGRTLVARLDLATLAVTQLGRVPGQPDRCEPATEALVCRHHDRLWIWPTG